MRTTPFGVAHESYLGVFATTIHSPPGQTTGRENTPRAINSRFLSFVIAHKPSSRSCPDQAGVRVLPFNGPSSSKTALSDPEGSDCSGGAGSSMKSFESPSAVRTCHSSDLL